MHVARVRPEDDQQRVRRDYGDGKQQHELTMLRAGDEAMEHRCVKNIAERKEDRCNRNRREEGIEIEKPKRDDSEVHRDRHDFAVREINDARHAENHGQAQRHESVDKSSQHARDDDVSEVDEIDGHRR